MSGGVDSSVTAALLQNRGFDVVGITMCFSLAGESKRPRCCGREGIEDARRVAHQLGIKHYVLNMQKYLEEKVINDFCLEYLKGRTPNPCVRCNQYIKFDALLKKALSLDADFLATGHYARIERTGEESALKKAVDLKKDQSYFLYRLNQRQLKRVLLPLGDYTKEEVRKFAKDFGLGLADKPESQEICFIPDDDYRGFLRRRLRGKNPGMKPGLAVDKTGKILGHHKGFAFYTIGQREGLGIAAGEPLYVIRIDAGENRLVLGRKSDVYSRTFEVSDPHFIHSQAENRLGIKEKQIELLVKIRYNHKEAPAQITRLTDKLKIVFDAPQFAITPGQSAVFYKDGRVMGGGIIETV